VAGLHSAERSRSPTLPPHKEPPPCTTSTLYTITAVSPPRSSITRWYTRFSLWPGATAERNCETRQHLQLVALYPPHSPHPTRFRYRGGSKRATTRHDLRNGAGVSLRARGSRVHRRPSQGRWPDACELTSRTPGCTGRRSTASHPRPAGRRPAQSSAPTSACPLPVARSRRRHRRFRSPP